MALRSGSARRASSCTPAPAPSAPASATTYSTRRLLPLDERRHVARDQLTGGTRTPRAAPPRPSRRAADATGPRRAGQRHAREQQRGDAEVRRRGHVGGERPGVGGLAVAEHVRQRPEQRASGGMRARQVAVLGAVMLSRYGRRERQQRRSGQQRAERLPGRPAPDARAAPAHEQVDPGRARRQQRRLRRARRTRQADHQPERGQPAPARPRQSRWVAHSSHGTERRPCRAATAARRGSARRA